MSCITRISRIEAVLSQNVKIRYFLSRKCRLLKVSQKEMKKFALPCHAVYTALKVDAQHGTRLYVYVYVNVYVVFKFWTYLSLDLWGGWGYIEYTDIWNWIYLRHIELKRNAERVVLALSPAYPSCPHVSTWRAQSRETRRFMEGFRCGRVRPQMRGREVFGCKRVLYIQEGFRRGRVHPETRYCAVQYFCCTIALWHKGWHFKKKLSENVQL